MTYNEVIKYCMTLNGVSRKSLNPAGNAFAFSHRGKNFAYLETGAPIQWHFIVQVAPELYQQLIFPPKVVPAPDKPGDHWLSIARVESFDEVSLVKLIDWSYGTTLTNPTP